MNDVKRGYIFLGIFLLLVSVLIYSIAIYTGKDTTVDGGVFLLSGIIVIVLSIFHAKIKVLLIKFFRTLFKVLPIISAVISVSLFSYLTIRNNMTPQVFRITAWNNGLTKSSFIGSSDMMPGVYLFCIAVILAIYAAIFYSNKSNKSI